EGDGSGLAFPPGGDTLLGLGSGYDGKTFFTRLFRWEAGPRRERARLGGRGDPVQAVAFAPDGKTLASAAGFIPRMYQPPGAVRLRDAVTGQERASLKGHEAGVFALAFAPDGRAVATGSGQFRAETFQWVTGEVRLWDP